MKAKIFAMFCLCLFITNVYCSSCEQNIIKEVEREFSGNPKRAFKKFNEEDYFIELYHQSGQKKSFSELSQEEYGNFKDDKSLFKGSPEKKITDLIFFAQLAGCPILTLSQSRSFFYDARHIFSPSEEHILDGNVNVFPYEGDFIGIKKEGDEENKTFRVREISPDLRDNAIIYTYLNLNHDQERYKLERLTHYDNHDIAKLSYNFLEDYIVSPYTIARENPNYITFILSGLDKLPKAAINLMRGKAIYISSKNGNSGVPFTTSHNAPIISYLGLIPGIFIESNSATYSNIVLMVGHLIEKTVFRTNQKWTGELQHEEYSTTIDFPYQFTGLENIKNKFPASGSFAQSFSDYVFGKELDSNIKEIMMRFYNIGISFIQQIPQSYPVMVNCSERIASSSSSSSA